MYTDSVQSCKCNYLPISQFPLRGSPSCRFIFRLLAEVYKPVLCFYFNQMVEFCLEVRALTHLRTSNLKANNHARYWRACELHQRTLEMLTRQTEPRQASQRGHPVAQFIAFYSETTNGGANRCPGFCLFHLSGSNRNPRLLNVPTLCPAV